MNAQQARRVLLAYRPWADDAQDPEVREAIALCQLETELKTWFENHCAAQLAIRDRIRELAVPDGLKQQILSEHKSHVSVLWWRRPTVLATAAITVLLLALSSFWFTIPRQPGQDKSFSAYRNRMVRTVARPSYGMDLETNDVAQIRTYLTQQQAPGDYVLPEKLERTQTVGCGALTWQGKPVAMVCFQTGKPLPPGTKSDLFLFVINQEDLAARPETKGPVFAKVSTMITATWQAGGKIYLLASPEEEELKQRL